MLTSASLHSHHGAAGGWVDTYGRKIDGGGERARSKCKVEQLLEVKEKTAWQNECGIA